MCMFVSGHLFAAITGCAIPTTLLLLGESFNKFGPGSTSDDLLVLIKDIVGVMCAIAVGAWITMYLAWMLLSAFGTMVTYRIKQKYLAAILAQECAWFDKTNITELSAKLSRECAAINRAIGEKAGQVTFALALCFSGLVVGMTQGWGLALCMLAIGPFLGGVATFYASSMSAGAQASLQAYG